MLYDHQVRPSTPASVIYQLQPESLLRYVVHLTPRVAPRVTVVRRHALIIPMKLIFPEAFAVGGSFISHGEKTIAITSILRIVMQCRPCKYHPRLQPL